MPDSLLGGQAWFASAHFVHFLAITARITGALSLVPLPGSRALLSGTRAALIVLLSLTFALPVTPAAPGLAQDLPIALGLMTELAIGLAIGVVFGFLNELIGLAMQMFSLQSGYGYASVVDPNSEADSGVLTVAGHLLAGLLFFATGAHHALMRAIARSLEVFPLMEASIPIRDHVQILQFCGSVFELALRLAIPLIALLALIDLTLGLLGRLNTQLQILSLAFPVKMLVSLLVLALVAASAPALYRMGLRQANAVLSAVMR